MLTQQIQPQDTCWKSLVIIIVCPLRKLICIFFQTSILSSFIQSQFLWHIILLLTYRIKKLMINASYKILFTIFLQSLSCFFLSVCTLISSRYEQTFHMYEKKYFILSLKSFPPPPPPPPLVSLTQSYQLPSLSCLDTPCLSTPNLRYHFL